MKYKLLKDLPLAKAGTEVQINEIKGNNYSTITCVNHFNQKMNAGEIMNRDIPDWLEPIVEKKTYDDLKSGDRLFYIDLDGTIFDTLYSNVDCRSQVFLTREEAEDEHKRREWAVRKNKFFPSCGEEYWYYNMYYQKPQSIDCYNLIIDVMLINNGLAFRTREDCQDAIDNHEIIRLFYTIR